MSRTESARPSFFALDPDEARERIEALGGRAFHAKVIRREVRLQEGDLYSESGKERSEMRVLRLGYFNDVTVSTSRGSADDQTPIHTPA